MMTSDATSLFADVSHTVLAKFFDAAPPTPPAEPSAVGPLYQSASRPGLAASDLSVLGIAPDDGACGYYRVVYPLMCLAELGARVEVRRASGEIPLDSFFAANVLYLSRAYTDAFRRDVEAVSRLTGATVVYDLDDYLRQVSPTSSAFGGYDPATPSGTATLESIDRFLASADGAVFSTRELQAQYANLGKSSHVLFNGLDLDLGTRDWDLTSARHDWKSVAASQGCDVDADSLLFGWSGSSTHYDNLLEMGDAVARVLAQTRNTFFGIFTEPHLACHFCVERWGLPLNRVVHLAATSFQQYPRVLSAFDVALAPLRNDVFNRSKSNLRLLEHGAWGIPYVASKVAPYYRLHRETNGQGGEIASSPSEFVSHTVQLLTDADLRRQKGEFLETFVRTQYAIRRIAAALPYTLKAIQQSRGTVLYQPSLRSLEDASRGVPKVSAETCRDSPCPCGSGATYEDCPHGCPPAFGELIGGETAGNTPQGNAPQEDPFLIDEATTGSEAAGKETRETAASPASEAPCRS